MGDEQRKGPRELRVEARRLSVLADAIENGTWGKVQPRGVTPGELADALSLSGPAANNRLRALYDAGLLSRQRIIPTGGGKQFRYYRSDNGRG